MEGGPFKKAGALDPGARSDAGGAGRRRSDRAAQSVWHPTINGGM